MEQMSQMTEYMSENVSDITRKTTLEPVYNGYQYLFVIVSMFIINLILYVFSRMKYVSVVIKKDPSVSSIGFLPELYPVYKKFGKSGPFTYSSELCATNNDTWSNIGNQMLMGWLALSVLGILGVLISDIILQIIKSKTGGEKTEDYE
jgi:hypothetical protein